MNIPGGRLNKQADTRQVVLSLLEKYPVITVQMVAREAKCKWFTAEKMLRFMCQEENLKMIDFGSSTQAIFFMKKELYATWMVVNEVNTDGILPE